MIHHQHCDTMCDYKDDNAVIIILNDSPGSAFLKKKFQSQQSNMKKWLEFQFEILNEIQIHSKRPKQQKERDDPFCRFSQPNSLYIPIEFSTDPSIDSSKQ